MPNLALGHSLDDLLEIGEGFSAAKKSGCSRLRRLSPGQLEGEMKRKAWLTFRDRRTRL